MALNYGLADFPSDNPRAVALGGLSSFRAAPSGLFTNRFAWADPTTGLVSNVYAPSCVLGLVSPLWNQTTVPKVPGGYQATLFSGGNFLVRFPAGASIGERVYASAIDGTAVSGETEDSYITPWYVASNAAPGGNAIITTWSRIE